MPWGPAEKGNSESSGMPAAPGTPNLCPVPSIYYRMAEAPKAE